MNAPATVATAARIHTAGARGSVSDNSSSAPSISAAGTSHSDGENVGGGPLVDGPSAMPTTSATTISAAATRARVGVGAGGSSLSAGRPRTANQANSAIASVAANVNSVNKPPSP